MARKARAPRRRGHLVLVAFSITQSGVPTLPSGLAYLRAPFYHYLAAPLTLFDVDWLPRLISVVASGITAVLVWQLGRRWLGTRVAWVATALYCFSLFEINLARQVRMYALYQVLALLVFWAAHRFWDRGRSAAGSSRPSSWRCRSASLAGRDPRCRPAPDRAEDGKRRRDRHRGRFRRGVEVAVRDAPRLDVQHAGCGGRHPRSGAGDDARLRLRSPRVRQPSPR